MFDGFGGVLVGLGTAIVAVAVIAIVGIVVILHLGSSQGAGTANTTAVTAAGYLGTGTGGLVTYIPIFIALAVLGVFLSFFGGSKR